MSETAPDVYVYREVQEVRRLHENLFTDDYRLLSVREQLDRQAHQIVKGHQDGNMAVATHLTCWHPELVGRSAEEIMGRDLTLEDARQTIAREYGFANWSDVDENGVEPPDADFESAVDALLAGNVDALRTLLRDKPSLAHQRSRYGHRSTLLHYVGSNGVETYRQVVPMNLAEVAQVLLDAGADVNATAEMYGGGSTTIALLVTSSHPEEAGVMNEVVKVLINAGAETDTS